MDRSYEEGWKLKKALAPFKRRATAVNIFKYLSFGITGILSFIVICMLVSFAVPFVHMREYIIGGSAIILVLSLIVSLFMRPKWQDIAKLLDRYGLGERVITALELLDRDDVYAKLQRSDTLSYIDGVSPKIIRANIPKRQVYVTIVLCIGILLLALLPNPKWDIVKRQRDMEESIKEMAKELEKKGEEGLKKADELTEEEKKELKRLLSSLSKELEKSRTYKDGIAKISNAQEEIDKLLVDEQKKKLSLLSQALKDQDMTTSLGEAMEREDVDSVKDEIQKLEEQLQDESMQKKLMDALATAFRETAAKLPDGVFKEQLMAQADAISGNMEGAIEGLNMICGEVAKGMEGSPASDPGDIKYLLQDMKNSMLDGADALAHLESANFAQGQTSQGGEGAPIGQRGGGAGTDTGGTGQNGTTGQGGAGQGSIGQGGTGQGGAGQGSGIGQNGHSNQVGEPNRLGDGSGEIGHVKGTPSNSGRIDTIEIEGGIGGMAGPVPYDRVIGTYKKQAMEALDRKTLPKGLEDIVKDYFNGLED